jgi:hypothetical protein
MHSLGIKILAIFYCGAGGIFGEFIRAVLRGRASEWFTDRRGFLIGIAVSNVIAISCLVLLRRRSVVEAPMQSIGRPFEIVVRGLPVTNRVAFLLFSIAWVIGLILGIVFSI